MKLKEIRSRSDAELGEDMARLRRELYNLRAQAVTSPAEDTTRFRKARRTVARILTVLGERARSSGKPAPIAAAPKAPAPAVKAVKQEKTVRAEKAPAAPKAEKPKKAKQAEKPKTPVKSEKVAKGEKKGQKG